MHTHPDLRYVVLVAGFSSSVLLTAIFTPQALLSGIAGSRLVASPATAGSIPAFEVKRHDGLSDWVPRVDFAANKIAVISGNWSSPGTWSGGAVPADGDVVRIPEGLSVTYDVTSPPALKAIGVSGALLFNNAVSTKMKVGTILVYESGSLIIKPDIGQRADITFSGTVNTTEDPSQMANGLIVLGRLEVEGAPLARAFTKTVLAPAAANKITLAESLDLKPGDRLYMADGRMDGDKEQLFPAQGEFATVLSVSGLEVTLTTPLTYTHSDSYVANVSRSVTFASDPAGDRAQGIFLSHASPSIKNAAFVNFGRTSTDPLDSVKFDSFGNLSHIGLNQIGRYPLHFHHLHQPFEVSGSAVVNEAGGKQPRWGIVSHYSFGNVLNNVVVDAKGAGIVTEQGVEVGAIEGNIVFGNMGGSGSPDPSSTLVCVQDSGHGGFGYWLRSPFSNVRNNVAAGLFADTAYFLNLFHLCSDLVLPDVAGMPEDLRGKTQGSIYSQGGFREFSGNSVDTMVSGGAKFSSTFAIWGGSGGEATTTNYKARMRGHGGVAIATDYQGVPLHIDGAVVTGIPGIYNANQSRAGGVFGEMIRSVINSRFENLDWGINLNFTLGNRVNIRNSHLSNYDNIVMSSSPTDFFRANGRFVTIDNVVFGAAPAGRPQSNIKFNLGLYPGTSIEDILTPNVDILIRNYNGVAGDNFQVYASQQAASYVVPEIALSNVQISQAYGRAVNGATTATVLNKVGITGGAFAGPLAPSRTADIGLMSPKSVDDPTYQLQYSYITLPRLNRDPQIILDPTIRTLQPGINWLPVTLPDSSTYYFPVMYTGTTTTPPPAVDTEAPTVSLSSPVANAMLTGVNLLLADAADNIGVTKVEFVVDGRVVGTVTTAPYKLNWDTKTVSDGAHTIIAKAYDARGNVGQSAGVAFETSNPIVNPEPPPPPPPKDVTAPTVSITYPSNGSTIAGRTKLMLTANASDNVGVLQVQFIVNSTTKCTDSTAPYSCRWNVSGKKGTVYTITAKAFDAAGNVGTSIVKVTVR